MAQKLAQQTTLVTVIAATTMTTNHAETSSTLTHIHYLECNIQGESYVQCAFYQPPCSFLHSSIHVSIFTVFAAVVAIARLLLSLSLAADYFFLCCSLVLIFHGLLFVSSVPTFSSLYPTMASKAALCSENGIKSN